MVQPYPAAPQLPPQPVRPPAPQPVRTAVIAMFVGAAAEVAQAITVLAAPHAIKAAIVRARPGLTAHQVSLAQNAAVIESVVVALIGAGLFIWIALSCRGGRNWARITGTVLCALGVVSLLAGLRMASGGADRIVSAIAVLAGLVAVILLWQRSSSRFFSAASRSPRS